MEEVYFWLTIWKRTVIGTIGGLIVWVLGILMWKSHKTQIKEKNIVVNKGTVSWDNINKGINNWTIWDNNTINNIDLYNAKDTDISLFDISNTTYKSYVFWDKWKICKTTVIYEESDVKWTFKEYSYWEEDYELNWANRYNIKYE